MRISKTLLLLAAVGAGLGLPARAADLYTPVEEAPLVPVEVGSGWYLRGDVSYDFKSDLDVDYDMRFKDRFDVEHAMKDKFDGFGLDENVDYGVGFGYQFTDYFRGDLTGRYWKTNLRFDGKNVGDAVCLSTGIGGYECEGGDADATAWELMANAYLDLGTFAGITPYVGGGVGAVHLKYDDVAVAGTCSVTGVSCGSDVSFDLGGGNDWRFAYALTAGASYDLTQNLKLDIGYRYLNVDGGDILDGKLPNGSFKLKDDGFDRHTIQAGLRYSLF